MHAWALLRPLFQGRRLAAATAAVSLSAVGLVGFAGVASAHANKVSGTAVCQSDGTYTVTWTVANDFNLSESVTAVSHSGGGTVSGLPTTIAASPKKPYNTATVTQSGIAGTATFASIIVNGVWGDGYHQADTGQLSMSGLCGATPTFAEATCTTVASYTVPAVPSDYYFQAQDGKTWSTVSGTVTATAGTTVNIRLMQKKLGRDQQIDSWSHTFAQAPRDCTTHVIPAVPTLTQTSCDGAKAYVGYIEIPTTTGVVYEENGKPVSGDIETPGSHTITAVATAGYTLDGTTSWTFTLGDPATLDCTTHVTPTEPTLQQSSCDGTTSVLGAITIPDVEGVIYKIGADVVTGETITSAGTYTITAVAAPGYTLDGVTSWTLTIDQPGCTLQQPSMSVTGTCNGVTYTFTNDTIPADNGPQLPALVLGKQPAGPVTFDIYKNVNGSWNKIDSVTVDPGKTGSATEHGAGAYRVQIGDEVQEGSGYTVSGNCPVPPPPPASIVSVSGSVTSSCPTVAGTTGSYVVDVTNAAQSTQSVQVKVSDGAKVLATSGDIASGKSFSYTGTLTAGQGAALKADFSADGGATWTAVALSGSPTIVCPTVLGEQFNQPPTSKPTIDPTSKPTQTLPFTGIPVVPTVLLALGLVMGGTLMVVIARRGRGELLNG